MNEGLELPPGVAPLDMIAFAWFLICWIGYQMLADSAWLGRNSLHGFMIDYRAAWLEQMCSRENRMVDVQVINILARSVSFFASTTIFIIAGLIAVFGAKDEVMRVLDELPFAVTPQPLLWDYKVFVLIILFVYGFFKFTWALRQYNYVTILVGAAPTLAQDELGCREMAASGARIAGLASQHFNRGIRAYYFGLGALSWFVQPWLFMLLMAWVVLVLHRREFRSNSLAALKAAGVMPPRSPAPPP